MLGITGGAIFELPEQLISAAASMSSRTEMTILLINAEREGKRQIMASGREKFVNAGLKFDEYAC
jgi:hypothetical protein